MHISEIRSKLHQFIDSLEDQKAEALYALFATEMDTEALRKQLVREERSEYLAGNGPVYSWEEVQQMAKDKVARRDL
jgi:hypothetical protein